MGFVTSYGLFVAYYISPASPFERFPSSTWTWPGSIQIFLFCLLATLSGRLFDAGYYRPIMIFGFTLQMLGVFATSFSRTYAQIFLSQGLAQGIGNGFVLCPTMSLISTYFLKKRTVAVAWAASGTATGGIIFPLIAQQLLPRVGFGWTVRVMGFVMLGNIAIIMALARTRIPGRQSGPWLELGAFREPPYVLFICGMFCIFLALYFAFSYVRFEFLLLRRANENRSIYTPKMSWELPWGLVSQFSSC
jgi:MFS family permease